MIQLYIFIISVMLLVAGIAARRMVKVDRMEKMMEKMVDEIQPSIQRLEKDVRLIRESSLMIHQRQRSIEKDVQLSFILLDLLYHLVQYRGDERLRNNMDDVNPENIGDLLTHLNIVFAISPNHHMNAIPVIYTVRATLMNDDWKPLARSSKMTTWKKALEDLLKKAKEENIVDDEYIERVNKLLSPEDETNNQNAGE